MFSLGTGVILTHTGIGVPPIFGRVNLVECTVQNRKTPRRNSATARFRVESRAAESLIETSAPEEGQYEFHDARFARSLCTFSAAYHHWIPVYIPWRPKDVRYVWRHGRTRRNGPLPDFALGCCASGIGWWALDHF